MNSHSRLKLDSTSNSPLPKPAALSSVRSIALKKRTVPLSASARQRSFLKNNSNISPFNPGQGPS